MQDRDVLIDVSRLVWRLWRGGLPTGVDRVCLAYVQYFRGRSRAVVQRGGRYFVLTREHSARAFDLFLNGTGGFRREFLRLAVRAFPAAQRTGDGRRQVYLNVGHTGLDDPSLPTWIAQSGVRAIFLIHDLIPLLYPEYCRVGEGAKHKRRIQQVLKSAHGLIGNSQATIDELATFAATHGLPMPPSVAAWIAGPPIPSGVVAKHFDRPHFIAVGTIEGRKNHSLLLHIWKRLIARYGVDAPILAIVGQRGWEAGQATAILDRATDLRNHVLELGKCGDAELAALIAGARALLMPSFAEGFGLPVAEALELGTPVIASNLAVYREFAFEIPTYLDALDGIGWEAAITGFAGDSIERERQLRAMAGYRAPDWDGHFQVIEEWLQTIS